MKRNTSREEKMKRVISGGLCSIVLLLLGAANVEAAVFTDNFDAYANGTNLGQPPLTDVNWMLRGDKFFFQVVNPTGAAGDLKLGTPICNGEIQHGGWWKPNVQTTETYQSVSIEFNTGSLAGQAGNDYGGGLRLVLNQDVANAGYYLGDNGYTLIIRGIKDMWLSRTTTANYWGGADPGQAYYDDFGSGLQANTTYKATVTKDGSNFTATVATLEGTIIANVSYTEAVAALTGGNAGMTAVWGPDWTLDNFQYALGPVPEPASLVLLGLAGLGLVARRRR